MTSSSSLCNLPAAPLLLQNHSTYIFQRMSKFPLDYYSSAQEGGGIRTEQIPAKLSLLVLDSIDSPAHFVLLELISTALRADRPVILLLSEDGQQQEEYWLSLLQKNRITRQQQQQLLTITTIIPLEPPRLLQLLQASSHTNPLLIINSLSSIIWDNNQPSHQLTHTFRSLLPSQLSPDFSLVYVFHDDLLKTNNQRDREIFSHLINSSDIIIRTRALGGQGQGQGELIIQRGPGYLGDLTLPITTESQRTTQFNILDHAVSFHPKGLHKAFI